MAKYKDFDLYYKEHKSVLLVFTLFKTKYTMPASMPAKLMLEILRGQKEDDLDPKIVLEICESLLGKKQLDDLVSKGFTVEQMENIINWAAEEYGQKVDPLAPAADEGSKINFQKQK